MRGLLGASTPEALHCLEPLRMVETLCLVLAIELPTFHVYASKYGSEVLRATPKEPPQSERRASHR
jgi:hypothetical protein